ncbi:carbon-nitrogen hydrolase family protein [Archaeoglobales archaeon]|nr:MAG: carbon-nitrogen hydrolase family protein [Archaeoglobales archaeon]
MELKIAAVQCKVGSKKSFESAERLIKAGIDENVEVFLLPEYFSYTSGGVSLEKSRETLTFLQNISLSYGCIVAGNVVIKAPDGKGYFNALHVFENGEIRGVQEKIHPTRNERGLGVREGEKAKIFRIGKVNFAALICADILYPEYCRVLAIKGAEIVFNPVVSVEKSELPAQELRHCLYFTRSFDNGYAIIKSGGPGVTMLGSKAVGRSLISSPTGIEAIYTDEKSEELVYCEINLDKLRKHREVNYSLFERNIKAYKELLEGKP